MDTPAMSVEEAADRTQARERLEAITELHRVLLPLEGDCRKRVLLAVCLTLDIQLGDLNDVLDEVHT